MCLEIGAKAFESAANGGELSAEAIGEAIEVGLHHAPFDLREKPIR